MTHSTTIVALALLALSSHGYPADTLHTPPMVVTFDPTATRPYDPDEQLWRGPAPCSQYPESGHGTLRLSDKITPPRLIRKDKGDYSNLTTATPAFARFFAELTVSTGGRVAAVRVLRSVSDEFDEQVLHELESSVYEPATLDGDRVAVCIVMVAVAHP